MSDLEKTIETEFKKLETQITQKFDLANKKAEEGVDSSKKAIADLASMGKDFEDLQKSITSLGDTVTSLQQKGIKLEQNAPRLTMGAEFIASEQFKNFQSGSAQRAKMEFKNTIIGSSGSPLTPDSTIVNRQELSGIYGGAFRRLRVLGNAVPVGQTTSNLIHYTKELSWTNAAAETAEGQAKPQSTLTFTDATAPVQTIAHWIKASKQILDDAPQLQSYIDLRMSHGVNQRIETQVIAGNGTSPNLSGILTSGNNTAATFVSADNNFDLANRMKYQAVTAEFAPDFYMMNPADWGTLERIKNSGSDARYVGADGAINYLQGGLIPTLWGLPVIMSNSVTAGKIVCMASDAVMYFQREGTMVEIFEQDDTNVQSNLLTIRGEARGAFAVFNANAIIVGSLV